MLSSKRKILIGILVSAPLLMASGALITIFSRAGVFNNTVMGQGVAGILGGPSFTSIYNFPSGGQPGGNFMEAGTIGLAKDTTGATNTDMAGLFGGSVCMNITTNCEGGTFYSFAGVSGTGASDTQRVQIWGINPLVGDGGFAHVEMQNEYDINVLGTDTHVIAINIGGASTQKPTIDSSGVVVGPIGTNIGFENGFYCAQGATGANSPDTNGPCLLLDPQTSANNQFSQFVKFNSRSSGGTLFSTSLFQAPTGGFQINQATSTDDIIFAMNGVQTDVFHSNGGITQVGATLASLAPTTNGTIIYCTNCTIANPCASGGTGALAKRLNGVWVCN